MQERKGKAMNTQEYLATLFAMAMVWDGWTGERVPDLKDTARHCAKSYGMSQVLVDWAFQYETLDTAAAWLPQAYELAPEAS